MKKFALLLFLFSSLSLAKDPVPNAQALVMETQNLIRDPAARGEVIQKSVPAQKADRELKDLAGDEQTSQEIYKLAADIFGTLAENNGRDPDKMDAALINYGANPASFIESMTPAQRQKLQQLGKQIEAKKPIN
jgi:hypothetical protein